MTPFSLGTSIFKAFPIRYMYGTCYCFIKDEFRLFSITSPILIYSTWEQLPQTDQEFFHSITSRISESGKELYQDYFLRYNLIHEAFHSLRAIYGLCDIHKGNKEYYYLEESIVHNLTVAFWKLVDPEFTERLKQKLKAIVIDLQPNPLPLNPNIFFLDLITQNNPDLLTYTYMQFELVLDALELDFDFDHCLSLFIGEHLYLPKPIEIKFQPQDPFEIIQYFDVWVKSKGYRVPTITIIDHYFPTIQCLLN